MMEQENTYNGLVVIEGMGTEKLLNFPNSSWLSRVSTILSVILNCLVIIFKAEKLLGGTCIKDTENSSMFQIEQDTHILSKNYSQEMSIKSLSVMRNLSFLDYICFVGLSIK